MNEKQKDISTDRNYQNMGDLNIVYTGLDTPLVENGEIIMKRW